MPRKPRIHVPDAFYHVTLRGNHRHDIFFCEHHRDWLDDIVAEAIQRFSARVHAYCWMTNHIHLLVQVGRCAAGSHDAAYREPLCASRSVTSFCHGTFVRAPVSRHLDRRRRVSADIAALHSSQSGAGAAGGCAHRVSLVESCGLFGNRGARMGNDRLCIVSVSRRTRSRTKRISDDGSR